MKKWMQTLRDWAEGVSDERRRAPRSREPSLKVYYWDGSAPEGRKLRDISASGAYIVTHERWYVGTIVRLILQEFTAPEGGSQMLPSKSTTLLCRVVRHGSDGVGVEFMFTSTEERQALEGFLSTIPKTYAEPAGHTRGQALIEFALVLPLLFLLIVNTTNFAGFLFAWITVSNAARSGAQYMVRGGSTFGAPSPATAAQVTALVTSDVASLPNRSSLALRLCTTNAGVVTCSGSPAGTPAADPEPVAYVLGSVDVTYTYLPFIPLWEFSNLGIHATLPASRIHRQVSMRMLQ